jgi:hypothetical protein
VTETVSDDHPIVGAIVKLKNPSTQKAEIEEQCNILAAQCSKGCLIFLFQDTSISPKFMVYELK